MDLFVEVCAILASRAVSVRRSLDLPAAALGCRANFAHPPIAGALPALVGWGILRSVWFGWKLSDENRRSAGGGAFPVIPLLPGG